jgi:hypothetical protein
LRITFSPQRARLAARSNVPLPCTPCAATRNPSASLLRRPTLALANMPELVVDQVSISLALVRRAGSELAGKSQQPC